MITQRQEHRARNMAEEKHRRNIFALIAHTEMDTGIGAVAARADNANRVSLSHSGSFRDRSDYRLKAGKQVVRMLEGDDGPVNDVTGEVHDPIGRSHNSLPGSAAQIDTAMARRILVLRGLERMKYLPRQTDGPVPVRLLGRSCRDRSH